VTLDEAGEVTLTGTLSTARRVHVYDLGPCEAGDRIVVSVDPAFGSVLDPVTAVFDANEEVFALNDDIDTEGGNYGSYIDEVVWIPSTHFYLAISMYYHDQTGGAYNAVVRIERGGGIVRPPVQALLLDFDGGSITILGEGTIEVDAFDAAKIDPAYDGQTEAIKAGIVETVRQNYSNTGIVVVTTDDAPPAAGTFSTIYFGSYSPTKFGVAQGVDQGNRDRCDDGIVFTEQFDDPFASQPSVEGIGVAIGNVAAHEAGHLLGLNHVTDVTDLMDTTGSASTLLADQEFKTSPLHASVFPFGRQNGPAILNRVAPK